MGKTLSELTDEINQFNFILDSLDGETDSLGMSPEQVESFMLEWMHDLCAAHEDKLNAYACVINQVQAEHDACKQQAKEFQRKQTVAANKIQFLKSRLFEHMKAQNVDRIGTELYKFSIVSNGGCLPLDVYDESQVPDEYKVQPPKVVDKTAVRAALEAGTSVPGAQLNQRGKSLRIR